MTIETVLPQDEAGAGSSPMADFIEALQEITEAKGAFKRDPFEHAKSCITDMAQTAIDVLRKHGIKPRGDGPH